ncbi:MAG TPA: hypothetical protein VFK05_19245 [Polyangiaceae bacterium]|nr:hypothetical protein [Polyangiaceae bacterium]
MAKVQMMAVQSWAAAALLLGSCVERKASRPDATTSSRTPVAQASSEAAAPAKVQSPPPARFGSELLRFDASSGECAALAADTERQLMQVRDPFESSSADQSAQRLSAFRALIREHTACVPSTAGAWATFFEGGADPRAWAWFVGFLPKGGAPAKHAGNLPDQVDNRASHASFTGKVDLFDAPSYFGPYRLQVVSDYDGDGTPEAVVWTAQHGEEIRSSARGLLWSFAKGRVAPYGKAEKFGIAPFEVDPNAPSEPAPLKDVDGDGRIDLLGYGSFFGVFKQGCGVIESFDALGPRLVRHALADGGFSELDAAAVSYAKQQCPARPTRILAFGEHGVDERTTLSNLGCARLWNVPASAIDSERKAACGVTQPPSSDCEAKRKCSPEVLAVLAAWSKLKAPFTLD